MELTLKRSNKVYLCFSIVSFVVSSNSWPSLKEICVFKGLSVLMVIISLSCDDHSGFGQVSQFSGSNPTPENQDSVKFCWLREHLPKGIIWVVTFLCSAVLRVCRWQIISLTTKDLLPCFITWWKHMPTNVDI